MTLIIEPYYGKDSKKRWVLSRVRIIHGKSDIDYEDEEIVRQEVLWSKTFTSLAGLTRAIKNHYEHGKALANMPRGTRP